MASAVGLLPERAVGLTANWNTLVVNTEFSPRDSCRRFRHAGELWLSNGYQSGNVLVPDLWSSVNGLSWKRRNAATPWRGWSPITSYGGAIVAVGEKVYRSTDLGATWAVITDTLPFVIGDGQTIDYATAYTWEMIEFAGKLMIFATDRVWYTTDLINWSSVLLPWAARYNYGIAVVKGEVHVMGGNNDVTASPPEVGYPGKTSFKDHWKSADPLNAGSWVQVTADAPFGRIMWPGVCAHGDQIVLAGGYRNYTPINSNDTYVFDGTNWRQVTLGVSFTARHYPVLFSTGGRVIITTGNRNPNVGVTTNDVLELL